MSSHHSDQMSQRSQVSRIAPLGCSLMEVQCHNTMPIVQKCHLCMCFIFSESGIGQTMPTVQFRDVSGLRLSEFVQISEFFNIYITDICQTSESFAKSVKLK